jgi:glycosyltransferase involved in cell wall biosynthesis
VEVPIKISVVICTYNRCKTLAAAIDSVVIQAMPESLAWEILVVDNNSTDQTRQAVEALQRQYPERIRYVFEPEQGVSHARNTGVREARGEIVAFIDDDETAHPKWLEILTANLHDGQWSGAGGRIVSRSDFSVPSWLSMTSWFASGPLALFDSGSQAGQLHEPPFSANMAYRKEVFDKYGLFRTDLGRTGNNLISNEDTEFGRRVMGSGLRLRYEPSALTYHPVEEIRLRRSYFLNWWFNKGRSDVREFGNQPNGMRFLGIPLRLFLALFWHVMQWMVALGRSQRFGRKLEVWSCAGQISESYHRRFDAKRNGADRNSAFPPPVIRDR